MENITYFDIIKEINGKLVTFRKYINTDTGQLVTFDTNDECNFVQTTNVKLNIKCAVLCEPLPCNLQIYNTPAPTPTVINSTCQADLVTISGGVINAPTTACPSGSILEYSVDGGTSWSTTVPMYNQTSAMTITTRCLCTIDTTVSSPVTNITTVPATCPNCDPTLTTTSAPTVIVTESTCAPDGMTLTGGTISAPTGSCPSGSTLEYSTDNVMWSTTLPTYDQATAITIYTRCVCDSDNNIISIVSSVTTVPDMCTACQTLSGTTTPAIGITDGFCSPDGITYTDGSFNISATTCPAGSTLEYSIDGTTWSTTIPTYNQTTSMVVATRCVCDTDSNITSIVASATTMPDVCLPEPPLNVTMCGTMCGVSTGGELIEFDMSTPSAVTETVLCTGLTYQTFRYADIAKSPDGTTYVTISNLINTVNPANCAITNSVTVSDLIGAGLSYFRAGKLIYGIWQQNTDNLLDLKTVNPNTGANTLWADTTLLNLTPAGDFIQIGNQLYITLAQTGVIPPNKFIYRFGINPDNSWDGTAVNLGMLPNGGASNEWFGLALVNGVIYAVNSQEIYSIDVNDVPNPTLVFTSAMSTGSITGLASIEDGFADCPVTISINAGDLSLSFSASNILSINEAEPPISFSTGCAPITVSLMSGTEVNCTVVVVNDKFNISITDNTQDFSFQYMACCVDGNTCDTGSVTGTAN